MGRHKEWRKLAKRERRRRIRMQQAKTRDFPWNPASVEYQNWLKEQETIELFEAEQNEKTNLQEHEKWLKADKISQEQWQKLQEKKEKMLQLYREQEAKLKLEWELEQERKKKEEERLKEIEDENRRQQETFMKNLEKFLSGDSTEPPPELTTSRETKPNMESCPFFSKTACCRFGDECSRNHRYPGISQVLLATNFYSHFGLDNATFSEYDTDVMLEYEDSDTYRDFKEFFNDVLPEFEKFGKVVQFKVCNNYEKHLRGNTYVEYAELRFAVMAYRSLHTRWYGGKQLSLQFCTINSWKNAICGLQSRRLCPKGRACNFLHVFRNPNDLFSSYYTNNRLNEDNNRSSRSWRWSESPEVENAKIRSKHLSFRTNNWRRFNSKYRNKNYRRSRSRSPDRNTSTRRSRSRSPDRNTRRSRSRSADRNTRRSRSRSADRNTRRSRSRSADRNTRRSRSRSADRNTRRSRSRSADRNTRRSRSRSADGNNKRSRSSSADRQLCSTSIDRKTGRSRSRSVDKRTRRSRTRSGDRNSRHSFNRYADKHRKRSHTRSRDKYQNKEISEYKRNENQKHNSRSRRSSEQTRTD